LEVHVSSKALAAIVLSGVFGLSAGAATFAQGGPGNAEQSQSPPSSAHSQPTRMGWQQRHQADVQMQLDRAESRLQIRASQEQAWMNFADAFKALSASPTGIHPPTAGAQGPDAAQIASRAASMAMAAANRLGTLAQATSRLESVLSSNQKAILDQMARMVAGRAMRARMEGMMSLGATRWHRHQWGHAGWFERSAHG
jgi:LTXXQ motif family protein